MNWNISQVGKTKLFLRHEQLKILEDTVELYANKLLRIQAGNSLMLLCENFLILYQFNFQMHYYIYSQLKVNILKNSCSMRCIINIQRVRTQYGRIAHSIGFRVHIQYGCIVEKRLRHSMDD